MNKGEKFIPVLGGLVLTRRELFSALQFLLLTGTYQPINQNPHHLNKKKGRNKKKIIFSSRGGRWGFYLET